MQPLIQMGICEAGVNQTLWHLYGDRGTARRDVAEVYFDRAYADPPKVVAWFARLDLIDGGARRVRVEVQNVASERFELAFSTHGDALVWGVDVAWIAYGAPSMAPPEKLTQIEGIGPATMKVLVAAGIRSYRQLALLSASDIKALLSAAGSRFALIDPRSWPYQAGLAAMGEWERLAEVQAQLDGGRFREE